IASGQPLVIYTKADPKRGEDRDVLIKMNEPLRYAGLTFFQSGFDEKNDKVTILQVVRNPAALTPYISCIIVGAGLLTQFLTHLIAFGRRQKTKIASAPKNFPKPKTRPRPEERKAV
ncbi:MAG: hypothetical protein ABJC04_08865, partial [Verrucomicrobiota bacterium]